MDHQTLTAAEETAIIVVNAIRTHTSLCIPGATDAGHPAQLKPQPPTVNEGPLQTTGINR